MRIPHRTKPFADTYLAALIPPGPSHAYVIGFLIAALKVLFFGQ